AVPGPVYRLRPAYAGAAPRALPDLLHVLVPHGARATYAEPPAVHTALTPAPCRAILRATPPGAADGPLEPPPVHAGRGHRRPWAGGWVWAATVAGATAAAESPSDRVSIAQYPRVRRGQHRGVPTRAARAGLCRRPEYRH